MKTPTATTTSGAADDDDEGLGVGAADWKTRMRSGAVERG